MTDPAARNRRPPPAPQRAGPPRPPGRPGGITMRDIAEKAGVTPMTVSRALNRPETVSPATRARIQAIIEESGFIPNSLAGSLSSTKSRIVTAIMTTLRDSIIAEIVQGVTDTLTGAGYHLLLNQCRFDPREEEVLVRAALSWRPAGVIVVGFTHTRATRRMLIGARVPVVEINEVEGRPIDMAVGLSNFAGGRAMTEYLIARGHRRIGLIHMDIRHNERLRRRREGYFAALRAAGLPAEPSLTEEGPMAARTGAAGLAALLARHPDLDAVFCTAEPIAIGVLQECRRRGIDVPGSLAVAGWGDGELAAEIVPSLTTVRSPRYQIGQHAAECILDRLAGRGDGRRVIDLGFEIVRRQSA